MTLAYYLKRRDIKYKFNKVLEKNKRKYKKMGGRGASSGISIKKKKVYGTEYRRVLKKGILNLLNIMTHHPQKHQWKQ